MKTVLDIDNWARRDHYHFFSQFEEPFFGVCANVDCAAAYRHAKEQGVSFFLYYLFLSLKAANSITPFRYRIENEQVVIYDTIHASPTINRPNGTFGFSYINYDPDFGIFYEAAQREIERVRQGSGLELTSSSANVIHVSSIPWIHFTGLSHARSFAFKDCIPKVSFGKILDQGEQKLMPVSVHAHHGLMDGYEVGQFLELFQGLLNGD